MPLSAVVCAAAELASVVGFLLQLGFREAGRPAPIGAFSPLERDVASHLAQLGLLLPFKCAGGSMSKPVWYRYQPKMITRINARLQGLTTGSGRTAQGSKTDFRGPRQTSAAERSFCI